MEEIDINVKDDNGRTILMNMMFEQTMFSKELVDEIMSLVEKYGASPNLKDNSGKTILHYLSAVRPEIGSFEKDLMVKQWSLINSLAVYFLKRGNLASEQDLENETSLSIALDNYFKCRTTHDGDLENTRNFELINILLNEMLKEIKSFDSNKIISLLKIHLKKFVTNIDLGQISEWHSAYLTLQQIVKVVKKSQILVSFIEDVDIETEGLTIFGQMCKTYTQSRSNDKEKWLQYVEILQMFIHDFNPEFNIKAKKKNNTENIFSALLTFSTFDCDIGLAFEEILNNCTNVDYESQHGETPLLNLIKGKKLKLIKALVKKGANLNKLRTYSIHTGKETKEMKELPIEVALQTNDIEIIDFMVQNNASIDTFNVTGTSILHKSVENCARQKTKHNLNIVKLLANVDAAITNSKASFGMNLVHTAVNAGRDDADLSLDLESFIIKKGVNVDMLDDLKRTPLHYAFASLHNKDDTSACDPIQIVSMLVEAMDDKSIHQKDIYGCEALHYAALRGATVCCLLLLEKGKFFEIQLCKSLNDMSFLQGPQLIVRIKLVTLHWQML